MNALSKTRILGGSFRTGGWRGGSEVLLGWEQHELKHRGQVDPSGWGLYETLQLSLQCPRSHPRGQQGSGALYSLIGAHSGNWVMDTLLPLLAGVSR